MEAHNSLCWSGSQLSIWSSQWHLIKRNYKSVRKQLALTGLLCVFTVGHTEEGRFREISPLLYEPLRIILVLRRSGHHHRDFHTLAFPDFPKACWRWEGGSPAPSAPSSLSLIPLMLSIWWNPSLEEIYSHLWGHTGLILHTIRHTIG